MDNQSKILSDIPNINRMNDYKLKEVIINISNILIILKNMLEQIEEAKNNYNVEEEELTIIKLIYKSAEKSIKSLIYIVGYIYKIQDIDKPILKMEDIENIIKLDEDVIINCIIESVNESINNVEKTLDILDSYLL